MGFVVRLVPVGMICLALTGCAANELTIKRQAEAEAKIEHLIQIGKKNDARLNELSSQILTYGDQSKSVGTQVNLLQETIRELRTALDELKAKVVVVSQQAATPKVEVVNQATTLSSRDATPPADYVKAFGLYSANNFTEAISAFEAFMKSSPQSDYAANALYWIGECHYTLSDLPKAKDAFFKVAGTYPNSAKAPDALLKLGYTLLALKQTDKANAIFDSLIKSYPSSPAAIKARQRLTAG